MHISSSDRTVGIRIFVFGDLKGLQGKVLRIARLVEDRFPHQHTGMVAVSTDDIAGVLVYLLVPALVFVPILPAWCGYDDEESQFIAGIHKRRVLRIVGGTDNRKTGITQSFGVAPLLRVWQGVAHVGEVLVTVGADELVVALAIEVEAGGARRKTVGNSGCSAELEGTDANAGNATIERLLALLDAGGDAI